MVPGGFDLYQHQTLGCQSSREDARSIRHSQPYIWLCFKKVVYQKPLGNEKQKHPHTRSLVIRRQRVRARVHGGQPALASKNHCSEADHCKTCNHSSLIGVNPFAKRQLWKSKLTVHDVTRGRSGDSAVALITDDTVGAAVLVV